MPDELILVILLAAVAWIFWVAVEFQKARKKDQNRVPFRTIIPEYKPFYSELLPESYVVFDLETSGLDPSRYEILEIGAIRFESGKETKRFHTYVKPKYSIPYSASKINGITKFKVSFAPSFEEISDFFLQFIGDLPLVAHNARFDIHFLQTELGYYVNNEVIDTLKLARNLIPDLENYKLETLKHYFCISIGSHNALDDCTVTARVYQECSRLSEERWLQSRPRIDKTVPDDAEKLNERSNSYFQAIREILRSNEKNLEDIHVSLFKNQQDFSVNIGYLRLCKIAFLKKETYIALDCTEAEVLKILDKNGFQYRQDANSDIYKIVLPVLESINALSSIICRCFDKARMNFQ